MGGYKRAMAICTGCRRDVTGTYTRCPFCGAALAGGMDVRTVPAVPRALVVGLGAMLVLYLGLATCHPKAARAPQAPSFPQEVSWNGQMLRVQPFQAESLRLPKAPVRAADHLAAPRPGPYKAMELVATSDLHLPTALAVGPDGRFYIANPLRHCVVAVAPGGQPAVFAGEDAPGNADGRVGDARFNGITGLCWAKGTLYVAEHGNACVKAITADGKVRTVLGGSLPVPKALGRAQLLSAVNAVGVDGEGAVYALDGRGSVVVRQPAKGPVQLAAVVPQSLDLKYMAVQPNGTLYLSDYFRAKLYRAVPGKPAEVWVTRPGPSFGARSLALDPAGHLYMLGSRDRIDAVRPDGGVATILDRRRDGLPRDERPEWAPPAQLATGPDGTLYVADDNGAIWRYR